MVGLPPTIVSRILKSHSIKAVVHIDTNHAVNVISGSLLLQVYALQLGCGLGHEGLANVLKQIMRHCCVKLAMLLQRHSAYSAI